MVINLNQRLYFIWCGHCDRKTLQRIIKTVANGEFVACTICDSHLGYHQCGGCARWFDDDIVKYNGDLCMRCGFRSVSKAIDNFQKRWGWT